MKKFLKGICIIVAVLACSIGISYFVISKFSERILEAVDQQETSWSQRPEAQTQLVRAEAVPAVATDFTVAAENTVHAVVHIMSKTTVRAAQSQAPIDLFEYFFGYRDYNQPRQQLQPQVGYGSGVIISRDGYIVTNNHVVEGADEIEVTTNDQRTYAAKVIGTDPTTDIALIKIEENDLPTIPFGNSDELKVGEWVLAVGNPLNLTSTVTAGIVSAKARNLGIIGGGSNDNLRGGNANTNTSLSIESFIQTDAAVNPGNSGGALVNTRGELVGINTAIVSKSGAFSGYSFAIPVSIVSKVVTDLKQYGSVQRAMLGVTIQTMNSDLAKEKKIDMVEGVYVAGVGEHSGAQEAGIKEGDIILKVENKKVTTNAQLQERISQYRPGDVVKVEVLRGKNKETLEVTLRNLQGNTQIVRNNGVEVLGAAFNELSDQLKKQLNISYGIQVSGLTDGKLKAAGVRKGFIIMKVNDQRIQSVSQFESLVKDIQRGAGFGETALFIVGMYPTGKVTYYAVDMNE
ncbi:MAG: Do family serine endopeptidase [Bacteroidales bacterium]|nr:Do family serine endopeptidase [Bacteroidales bacterium]